LPDYVHHQRRDECSFLLLWQAATVNHGIADNEARLKIIDMVRTHLPLFQNSLAILILPTLS
jgi:hypothetical protein